MPDTPRSKWSNYDYRAVTAGVIFVLIAGIVFSSTPSHLLECSRGQEQCTVVEKTPTSTRSHSFPLATIQKARKECDKSNGQSSCEWTVRLVVKGDTGNVFGGIKTEQEAERYVQAVRDFLDRRGPDTLRLSRSADYSWVLILSGVGLVLIILGIRKNMADKGVI